MTRDRLLFDTQLPPDITVLIAGGTGEVGRVVVDSLLRRGATVIVPSRSQENIRRLRAALKHVTNERLVTLVGNMSDSRDATRLKDEAIRQTGRLDGVVASLGTFVSSPSLLDTPPAVLAGAVANSLLAHLVAAQTFVPALEELGGSYTFINGRVTFRSMGGSGLVSIATAGLAMLARALMHETADHRVRINELVLHVGTGLSTPEARAHSGRLVARQVVGLIVGQAKGQTIHVEQPEPIGIGTSFHSGATSLASTSLSRSVRLLRESSCAVASTPSVVTGGAEA